MNRMLFKVPAILYTILIFVLSSLPKEALPPSPFLHFDKITHFTEYLVYAAFLMLAFTTAKSPNVVKNALKLSLAVGIIYAASDEIHQLFVSGRECNILDFVADSMGIVAGSVLYFRIIGKNRTE